MKPLKITATLPLAKFDFSLPARLIGQQPIKPRDAARLLILDKITGRIRHRHFFDLPDLLQPGDVLVFNDSKVIPARLSGVKDTGGRVEIFLLKPLKPGRPKAGKQKNNLWQCLIGGKVKPGQEIALSQDVFAKITGRDSADTWLVEFNAGDKQLFALGETPLPPYIKAKAKLEDYQTVYAKEAGSVAAPTAGLHFTKKLLRQLESRGVQIEYVTLHVGLGTFAPVKTENLLEHKMHAEWIEIDRITAGKLNRAKAEGRRIIAVGTTAVRTLETMADSSGRLGSGNRLTGIFIYPGYKFKFTDAIITNFHLPRSTLLVLVSAFAGRDKIFSAYREAIKKKYKFFSFGDGMMIE
ncbi:MAG: tRNA preQ1(34) S-adenosylmethionine ribosyltransferase-isomerase QueA [Candidatus Buchananbacteria bacterium]